MNLIVVVPPTIEPVTLADCWDHLRLTPAGSPLAHPHDAMLKRHIATARSDAEKITKRAFCAQTIRLFLPSLIPSGILPGDTVYPNIAIAGLDLPRPPVISISSVKYYDANNALQSVDPSLYFVTDDDVPRLRFTAGFVAPVTFVRDDAVRVDYVAGYAPVGSPPDYAAGVPSEIKDAILLGVSLLYDRPDPKYQDSIKAARDALLEAYVVYKLA